MADIEINTADRLEYTFYPNNSGYIRFKVRAPNDAHIALTTSAAECDPMYEIFIGGWGNTKSVIRKNRTKPDRAEVPTPGILNGGEFRTFWVRWDNNTVSAGCDNNPQPFISWTDTEHIPIRYVGVCTGWGATGSWLITQGGAPLSGFGGGQPPQQFGGGFQPYGGGGQPQSFGGQQPQPFGGQQPQAFGGQQPQPFGGQQPQPFGGQQPQHFGGQQPQPFGGQQPQPFGGQQPQPFGAPQAQPFVQPPPGGQQFGFQAGGGGGAGGPNSWVSSGAGSVPPGAFAGGQDSSGEPLYVIRGNFQGALIPGKLVPSHRTAYVPWGGAENSVSAYEVLCNCNGRWVPCSGGNIPPNAVRGGTSETGEPLYIGRVQHAGTITCGKVQQSHAVCYIPYGGQEISFQQYEILTS